MTQGTPETRNVTGGPPPRDGVARVVARGLVDGLLEIALVGGVVAVVLGAAGGIGYAAGGGTGLLVGLGAGVLVLGVSWVVLVVSGLVVSGLATTARALAARRPRP